MVILFVIIIKIYFAAWYIVETPSLSLQESWEKNIYIELQHIEEEILHDGQLCSNYK